MTDANTALEPAFTEDALPIGAVLSDGQFTITGHLGAGGFGITYTAEDNVLGRTIVIKECFPGDFCRRERQSVVARSASYAQPFRSIVTMFMREARSLARLRHPNIVGVHGAFEENDTAYMVLDLIDGSDLLAHMKPGAQPLSPARVRDILIQLLDAVEAIHGIGLLHRDISPDNIILEKSGTPVLIDFGAARGDASGRTRAISALLVVKDGYSPQEFYVSGSEQAPCSDLYALGATFYHLLSGDAPPHSQTRLIEIAGRKPDPCRPLAGRIPGYDDVFLSAIDQAMQVHPADRLQSAARWKSLIADAPQPDGQPRGDGPRVSSKDLSLELEQSLSRLVVETNSELSKAQMQPAEEAPPPAPRAPEKPPAPDWVAEFNRDSAPSDDTADAPAEAAADAPAEGAAETPAEDAADAPAEDDAALTPAGAETGEPPPPTTAPRTGRSEIDWIHRAFEKQARIEAERRAALELMEEDSWWRITSTPGRSPQVADGPDAPPAQAPEEPRRSRPARLLAGLFVWSCLIFFIDPF